MQMYYTLILRVFWKWSTIFTLDIEMWSTVALSYHASRALCLFAKGCIESFVHLQNLQDKPPRALASAFPGLHAAWYLRLQLHRTADMTHLTNLTKHIEFNSLIYMSRIATPGDSRWQLPCFWSSVAFSNSRQPLMHSWRILCSQDSSLPCLHISKWTRFLHSLMKLEIKHKSWWSCWNRLTGLKSQIVTNNLCKVSFSKTILSV